MSYMETGILKVTDITIPSEERFREGPVAIIECIQQIPCNPCVDSCSRNAIQITGSINNIPQIDFDVCNGCGLCVANCPGLAIFLVDKTFEDTRCQVGVPFEFRPLPEAGETVELLDRAGEICGEGEVVKVRNTKAQDRTPIVFLAMDKDLAMKCRFFRRKTHEG
jgi:Fe-S-cluster-containing hydrogenase component 2